MLTLFIAAIIIIPIFSNSVLVANVRTDIKERETHEMTFRRISLKIPCRTRQEICETFKTFTYH